MPYSWKNEAVFRWSFTCGDVDEREDVIVRVDHAVDRGVPAPEAWQTALRCFDLRRLEFAAFANYSPPENLRELRDLRCTCLGAAKPVTSSNDGQLAPGACVALANEIGARTNYVLVAHEAGDLWLCHPGMFNGELVDVDAPIFHEDYLVRKNLRTEVWEDRRQAKRTRIAKHPKAQQLLQQTVEHGDHFAYLVAWAAWCKMR